MKMDLKDTAFTFRIHMGMTRKGEAFLESDTVENVLGDIDHRDCMSIAMEIVRRVLEMFLNDHFGQAKETITAEQMKQALDDDFFDKETNIDA